VVGRFPGPWLRIRTKHAVSSHWDTSSNGPARHVYCLTPAGEERLHGAAEAAVEMHATIQEYFGRYTAAGPRPPIFLTGPRSG
jgi:DNA-binding PadR family transcriptional regulator